MKGSGENYCQFYERLLQFAQLYIAQAKATACGLSNQVPDKMSNSIMNHWLRKINIQLLQIVKTEYSTELRSGEQLAALIPIPELPVIKARH